MNILLSCYAQRGKCAYVLEKGGSIIDKQTFFISKPDNALLKEYIFESIIKGLKRARGIVNHDDLLLIGVQNAHVAEWLNGSKEYKGYDKYLDDISDIIETLDCRYMFSLTNVKKAKKQIKENPEQDRLEGIASVFENM